ncbi:ataxin-1-like [Anolis carolinensis]|uniref:ataxin-1-like n=1 Tax=Anolis carolinensis TaxID=28377 RepID=UPI002F2B25F3
MRAAQERGQEFLPPKKRDLPPATVPTTTISSSTEEPHTAAEKGGPPSEWSQAPASPSSPWSGGVQAGLTLDQYGLLYKVSAFPSPPPSAVLSLGALPPTSSSSSAFGGVASPFLQAPGASFPQVHFAQLPPAPLQFLGGPFPLPYAPQGFLPGHLLPTTAGLQAPPHLVPFVPLLQEDPGPRAAQVAFGNKAQGRIPVYYQVSHLPPGYTAFEAPVASLGPELALREGHLSPEEATENGLHVQEGEAKEQWSPAALHCGTNGPISAVLPLAAGRAEALGASQRSSPEADLEVQRVVGVLAFQGHSSASTSERRDPSPLNLSHSSHGQKADSARNLSGAALAAAADRRPSEQEQEQLCPGEMLVGPAMANGKLGPFRPAACDSIPGSPSLEAGAAECTPRSQGHLPSHFMKGAIIQLATGELKRVEDLQTQDFVRSAEASGGLKIDSSTVVDIRESTWPGLVTLHFVVGEQQSKVSIDVPPEHPFFVYGQGWSSCSPERTARLFALRCHGLQVGDVCVSISLQGLNGRPAPLASPEGGERPGCARQGVLREPSGVPAAERSPPGLGGVGRGPSPEVSQLSPVVSALSWAGPGPQRLGEESLGPPLLRPSFIPQEVKLSIEGRSNAGK